MTALISRRDRRGLLVGAGLACALMAGMVAAEDTPRHRLAVWAVGLPSANFIMEYQAAVIVVTAGDVARGAVEVRGGSRLVMTTHSPTGYAVEFSPRGNLFKTVRIDGMGSTAEIGPRGGTVVQREATAGRRVIALNYRFILSPDTTPGTYPWPVDLVVRGTAASDLQYPVRNPPNATVSGRF